MSGDWPPEWDDPEEEFPSGADQVDTATEARLAEVTAYLASVPAPVLPDVVAARISAALAAEATARAGDGAQAAASSPADGPTAGAGSTAGASSTADGGRTLGAAPARARVRRHRGGAKGHRGSRSRPLMAVTSVLAGLAVVAGIGYGISRTSGATYSSSAASSSGESFAAAAPEASSSASASNGAAAGASPQFSVTTSGTKYRAATLAAQVRAQLAHSLAASGSPGTVPGPSGTTSAATAGASSSSGQSSLGIAQTPTTALRACALHLTGGQPPRLVDRASYEGEPAYIIASSSHVWVVGLGCTAANAELITSAALGS